MRTKLLSGVTALALTAGLVVTSAGSASAAPWGWRGWGWGWGGAALAAGAVAAATSPLWASGYYDYAPGYAYAPGYGYGYGGDYGYGDVGYGYDNVGYGYGTGYGYGNVGYAGYGNGVYDYAPGPYVATAAPAIAVAPTGGGNVAYCQQRYRSYDPASGTFLGYDGQRHPCP